MKEALEHSKLTFEIILKTWILTDKQRLDIQSNIDYLNEQLILYGVVSSCVDKNTLIEDLNDKRIVGKTIDQNMWHYCRKETAQHLLDKYEIRPK